MGDFTFARNTRYVLDELQEVKKGIDKMLLSSELVSEIGIHYSQSSLFATKIAMSENVWPKAIDSWSAIINDLGLNFEFVSYG